MAATVFALFNAFDMPPGVTWNFEWKNLPEGKAYAVDAAPFEQSTLNTTQVEVTRVWRRTRQIQKSGGLGVDIHRDILGQIKNVGTNTTSFTLFLVVFA